MRGRFGIERCCCDCVPCPNCVGGQAPRQFWIHLRQQDDDRYQGNYLVKYTGTQCRWETDDSYLPKRVLLTVGDGTAQLQVSNDDHSEVALWDFTVNDIGDRVDCDWWRNGEWVCREDTGTILCGPGAELEIQPVSFFELQGSTETDEGEDFFTSEPNEITDELGNIIDGTGWELCSGITPNPCLLCQDQQNAPAEVTVRFAGFTDYNFSNPYSVLNGDWDLTRTDDLTICLWRVQFMSGQIREIAFRLWDLDAPNHAFVSVIWDHVAIPVIQPITIYWRSQTLSFPIDCWSLELLTLTCDDSESQPQYLCTHTPGATVEMSAPVGGVVPTAGNLTMRGVKNAATVPCPKCGKQAKKYLVCRTTKEYVVRCPACGYRKVETNG